MVKKKLIPIYVFAVLILLTTTASAQVCYQVSIPDACCRDSSTKGWLYNMTLDTPEWQYTTRITPLFNISVLESNYYGLCIDVFTPITTGITYNASYYLATPTCVNNSIAYILNNWTIDCDHCDNVSAAQSAIWYLVYLDEDFCKQADPKYNHTAQPGEEGWESYWIPNCTAHPLACQMINESLNRSVPYSISATISPQQFYVNDTAEVTAEVSYCEGVNPLEVTVEFEINNSDCQFVENGTTIYKTLTQNGIAKANITCSQPGDYSLTVEVKDAKWFKILNASLCQNKKNYQATLALVPIVNDTEFSVKELQQPTIYTEATPHQVTAGETVTDNVTLRVPEGQPDPTGTVDFYLCDPGNVTSEGCPEGSGTYIGNDTLSEGTASYSIVIGQDVPLKTGKWCWGVYYNGDENYDRQYHTDNSSECFDVVFEPPELDTHSSVKFTTFNGTAVQDIATLTVPEGQPDPTGTVDFYLCDPDNVTSEGCPLGNGYEISTNPIVNGTATSDPVVIGKDVPAKEGWWCWGAYYNSDKDYYEPFYHTNRGSECFYVSSHKKVPAAGALGLIAIGAGVAAAGLISVRKLK